MNIKECIGKIKTGFVKFFVWASWVYRKRSLVVLYDAKHEVINAAVIVKIEMLLEFT